MGAVSWAKGKHPLHPLLVSQKEENPKHVLTWVCPCGRTDHGSSALRWPSSHKGEATSSITPLALTPGRGTWLWDGHGSGFS